MKTDRSATKRVVSNDQDEASTYCITRAEEHPVLICHGLHGALRKDAALLTDLHEGIADTMDQSR